MLNIFYGRENLNKSRFVFQNIEGKTLLVVPNQFTLEAERDAFFYLNKKILMDIDVISFSRLGGNIIQKTGGKFNLIGREGRQMLLSRILREEEKNLEVFQGSARKMEFVEMVHDLISDMKQHNLKPDQLEDALANVNHESLLYKKLSEVKSVFESYEKAIDGKYLDNEDYIQFYVDKVKDAQFIKESSIWIYGFDTFTEKNLVFIKELEKYARNVNVVLTYDQGGRDENLFAIGKLVIDKLKGICPDATVSHIGDEYLIAESEAMQALERELFAEPVEPCSTCEEIKLVKAANPYSEAATAASFILSLVRDKGYRFKDIALISNDIENQGEMYKRVFDEYGIKLFIDSKRNVLYHPAVMYIVSLLEIMGYNFGLEDVLKILKTGFVFDTYDEEELLEKYARKFNLKGAAWKKDFEKGKSFFGDKMDEINLARKKMMEPILIFEEEYKNAKTVKDKVKALYDHIENHMDMPQKIENLVRKQEEEGNLEGAEETAQIWKVTVGLLEQLVEILGDEKISNKDFADLVKTGFQSVEIGVIPPSVDGLIAGTMQRTRRGHTKVTVVIGAADGVLPRENLETGILNEDERSFLKENNIEICKVGSIRTLEENMAIYRNISKSEDMLYMSYAASDKDGKSTEPSSVYNKIKEIYPDIKEASDIFNSNDSDLLIGGVESTKNMLLEELGSYMEEGAIEEKWLQVYRWFRENTDIDSLLDNISGDFKIESMTKEQAASLYKKIDSVFSFSPSRLEKYGSCPFAHFVQYGLKPDENRPYEIGAAETGSVIHECMMEVSRQLSEKSKKEGIDITDENSLWMTVTKEEVDERVNQVLINISDQYMEGLLSDGKMEQYRAQRIKSVCQDTVWLAVNHVRKGRIKDMFFEINFGRGKDLPPLAIDAGGQRVLLEGQIDRFDILDGDYSKVIDYKSGKTGLDMDEVYGGRRLQLFIYLMATVSEKIQAGGAFYFPVEEVMDDGKASKMDGFVRDVDRVIIGIDEEEKVTKRIYKSGEKRILSEENFNFVMEKVAAQLADMARGIVEGEIGAKPKYIKKNSSCTYCKFKGICKFDISIEGCKYNMV